MKKSPLGKAGKRTKGRGWKHFVPIVLAVIVIFIGLFFVWVSTLRIPNLSSVDERKVSESTKIYDRTGKILLYDVNQETKRTVVPFEQISGNIKNATIAIEDANFYQNNGIEIKSIFRSLFADILSLGFSQGGSTITQQVVKNSLLEGDKTITRKLKELILAIKLNRVLSKDEILSLYLNEIPYGGNLYGVEEASQAFFGKSSTDLDIAESAYLAALPQAPTYYSPFGSHRDALEVRKNLVLSEMLKDGFITQSEYDNAKLEKVDFVPKADTSIKAPHFVFFVLDYLAQKYGEDALQNDGLRVTTTLDYDIEQKAEIVANQYALQNKQNFNAENDAFVAIDPKSGDVLAMVGSRNYFDKDIDGNFNIATAHRQPGSTFKPFVYSTAFKKGYTPNTVLFDVPTQFQANCAPDNFTSQNGCYSPVNYDGKFRGPITLRDALAQSINVPSVKTLYLAGVKDSIETARTMGITTLADSDQYGLTLVLGGGEVSLLDMTSAYGVFANEGVRNPYRSVLKVTDKDGNTLEEAADASRQVLDRNISLEISDILSDNVARTPSYGATSPLYFPSRDVAVKTGTTNDFRDAWIIGYTPDITLGAWAGNNDNSPMDKKVAGYIVAPMWRALMDEILPNIPPDSFSKPDIPDSYDLKPVLRDQWKGGISHLVDDISHKNATNYTPKETTSEILEGGVHSILYWLNKDDPLGPPPQNPNDDPQFRLWEYGVEKWAQENGYGASSTPILPAGDDDVHIPQNFPVVSIVSPAPNTIFNSNQDISGSVTVSAKYPISKFQYYINDSLVGENNTGRFSFSQSNLPPLGDSNSLKVVATDSVFNQGSAEVLFKANSNN